MNKKIIIAGLIIGVAIGLGFVIYNKKKKKCPCQNQNPEQAIDAMSDNDLRTQITGLNNKIDLAGKTTDQLKDILKGLIK